MHLHPDIESYCPSQEAFSSASSHFHTPRWNPESTKGSTATVSF